MIRVGHWTDHTARTGCTVVLFDELVPAVCDVRGGSPATRETELLAEGRLVGRVDAILLTGGSAFGLGAADGVMRYLKEHGRGWPTNVMPVPIVPAAALFDLGVGEAIWPTAEAGYSACRDAVLPENALVGPVGVGTGATFRKIWPGHNPLPGGFGYATQIVPGGPIVHAMVAVNAIGDVIHPGAKSLDQTALLDAAPRIATERESTTLGVIVVEGPISERGLSRLPVAAHDAYARCIVPSHTMFDGDIVFSAALEVSHADDPVGDMRLAVATELAMESAIQVAVGEPRG